MPNRNIEGIWTAAAEKPGAPAPPVVFRIAIDADGTPKAFMESPDQLHRTLMNKVTFENGHLHIDAKSIKGAYDGQIESDSMTIKGNWSQAGRLFPLMLKRTDELPRPNRPQEPKRPYPYDDEEVVYENRQAAVKLVGTLTLPRTKGPLPAVLLIGGSGTDDRDNGFSHRTFLVLADYLTRRGIATLRADKRGVWKSTGNFFTATTEDFARDALAGITYLKTRKEINPAQIGIIGHSEGAMIATMLATQYPDIAFIVLMAGAGMPLDKLLVTQNCLYAEADGASKQKIALLHDWYERYYEIAINEKDNALAEKKIRKIYSDLTDEQKKMLDWSEAKLNDEIKRVLSPWYRYLLAFDPKAFLIKAKCPVLAINGQKDLQVEPDENLSGIEQALKAGGNRHYIVKKLPGLNHNFQTAITGAESEYAQIKETFAPSAMKTVADWILKQAGENIRNR
ncbi:MAG: alpha/beta hydrolase [Planctomycetes bacterium]|nr:alpha/beta hydrolase [Planctomycetota bacterium]MBL7145419.1 alpha/beta hydrolase [Phycisphaerae bacterium]